MAGNKKGAPRIVLLSTDEGASLGQEARWRCADIATAIAAQRRLVTDLTVYSGSTALGVAGCLPEKGGSVAFWECSETTGVKKRMLLSVYRGAVTSAARGVVVQEPATCGILDLLGDALALVVVAAECVPVQVNHISFSIMGMAWALRCPLYILGKKEKVIAAWGDQPWADGATYCKDEEGLRTGLHKLMPRPPRRVRSKK